MRLIASNHWFVDGNKRTALNVTELFYLVNGYDLEYGDDFRSLLKLFSVREDLVDRETGPEYFRDRTTIDEVDVDEVDPRDALALVLVALVAKYSDGVPEERLPDTDLDIESIRDEFGLATKYGTTVNIDADEGAGQDGGQ